MRQRVTSSALALSVLGIAVTPVVASAAASSVNTTINANVGAAISITTVSPVTISLTPTSGGVVSSASDTVTVNTNNAAGYNLVLASSDTNRNLVSGANNFTPIGATPVALTNGTWGWAVNSTTPGVGVAGFDATYSAETNNASSTTKWAGVASSASPLTVKSTSSPAINDTTTVWYAAKANASQPNGTYTDTVTYTATTN